MAFVNTLPLRSIEICAPTEGAYWESFIGQLRNELLNGDQVYTPRNRHSRVAIDRQRAVFICGLPSI